MQSPLCLHILYFLAAVAASQLLIFAPGKAATEDSLQ